MGSEAIALYQKLATKHPLSATVWFELGELHYDSKSWQDALTAYQQAAKFGWQPVTIQIRLGKTYEKLKRYMESETAFRKALEGGPASIPALFGLASALFYQEKAAAAAPLFELLSKRTDEWGFVSREFLAQLYYDLGRFDEALVLVTALLEKTPTDMGLQWLAGRLYFKKKDYEQALPYFKQAVSNDPKRAEAARYYIAASLDGAGRKQEAESVYREVGRGDSMWGEAARSGLRKLRGPPFQFTLDYSGGYDTNVIRNNPDASPAGEDGFNQIYADISGRVLRTPFLNIWLGIEHFGLHYLELHDNDYIQEGAKIAFNIPDVGPFSVVSVRYQFNYSELNGDAYRGEHRFESSATYQSKTDRLTFGVFYSENNYFGIFKQVGGPEAGAWVDYRHRLPGWDHELRLRLNGERRVSDENSELRGVERARLQYRTKVARELYAELEWQYRRADYPESRSATLPRRIDERSSGEIQFDWQVQSHVTINWGYVFEKQTSSRALEKYTRHQGSIGLTLQF